MIVMKFGGSSVGSASAINQVADIIVKYLDQQPVVVVSAMQGVTDLLLALHNARVLKNELLEEELISKLIALHLETQSGLYREYGDSKMQARLLVLLEQIKEIGLTTFANLDNQAMMKDHLMSYGERLSAILVALALRMRGVEADNVEAMNFILTDNQFGSANVDFERTYSAIDSLVKPYIKDGVVPVVTGFVGSESQGRVTTLGRNGSDYTATLLGAGLRAEEVWLWKDIDGVMSADPKVVFNATVQNHISYDEAAELAYFGAKVLHSKAMIPVIDLGINIRIRNTFDLNHLGTIIGPYSNQPFSGVRAITSIRDLSIVSVEGKGMMGIAGLAAEVFGVAGKVGVNLLMFSQSSSEQNICLVCRSGEAEILKRELEKNLRDRVKSRVIDKVSLINELAAVAVIGEGMRGRIGISGKVFSAVASAGVNVLAIAQGSSERNISFVVQRDQAEKAITAIHNEFKLDEITNTEEMIDEQL